MKQWNKKPPQPPPHTHTQSATPGHWAYSRVWLIYPARFHWRKLIFSFQQVSIANSSLARGKTLCIFLLRAEMNFIFFKQNNYKNALFSVFFLTTWQLHQNWFSSPKWYIFQPISIKCFKMTKVSGLSTAMPTSFKISFYKFSCYHFINIILLYLKSHYNFFTINSNTEWLISTDTS